MDSAVEEEECSSWAVDADKPHCAEQTRGLGQLLGFLPSRGSAVAEGTMAAKIFLNKISCRVPARLSACREVGEENKR